MRNRIPLALVLALVLILAIGASASAAQFTDVQNCPFKASIERLADQSLVSGYADGTFRPDNTLQRQQFAKMAVLTLGYDVAPNDTSSFTDTPAAYDPVNDPLYPGCYVAVAAKQNIILGKTDGSFDFYGQLTRQQAISIVVRAAGCALAEPDAGYQGHLSYTDPTHGGNIKKAEFNGLLAHVPNLDGWDTERPATRGEAAELLAQLLAVFERRSVDPLVSAGWLADHLTIQGLVIVDIRAADAYAAGHIPQSINIPAGFSVNMTPEDMAPGGHFMELPAQADLFKLLGDAGITPCSKVVVVGDFAPAPAPPYALSDATRVADTLIYAGVKNVAILDGAYPAWAAAGKQATTDVPSVTASTYSATVDSATWVSTEYVKEHTGKAVILDARDANVYSGEVTEPWATKPGHIPTALSLPAPLMWQADGTYKSVEALQQLVSASITADKQDEIIVYCGVGGYESSWWYVLTQMLGYFNVKLYDGAAQAWAAENDMVK